jgi:hypothetical protein
MGYQNFDTYMLGLDFTIRKENHCVYFKLIGDHFINLFLYEDDMLLIGNNKEIDPGGYWWPPSYFTWTPTIASFSF